MNPVLEGKHLTKRFGSGRTEVCAVDNVSISIEPGELVLIMGPSGSGKTTLVSMLGGLLRPTSGSLVIDDVDVTALNESKLPRIRARKIGFVFQAFNLLEALTVEENILFPSKLVRDDPHVVKRRANELMDRLSISHRRSALPRTLSGGEKQRVAIARSLINAPPIVLADEPTGNLDSANGQEVLMTLHDVVKDHQRSVVVVSHDPRVEDVADRILWLEDGKFRDRREERHGWSSDPVCGMKVDQWAPEFSVQYREERFLFCSSRCLERFEENPEEYIAAGRRHE